MIIEFKLINMIKHNYCHDRTPFVSTFIGKLILYKANYMYFNRASIVTCEMLVCGLNYYYCVFCLSLIILNKQVSLNIV